MVKKVLKRELVLPLSKYQQVRLTSLSFLMLQLAVHSIEILSRLSPDSWPGPACHSKAVSIELTWLQARMTLASLLLVSF